ncbi:glycosyl transferase family 2 [Methylorubrum populi BJ001]|jgi:GT2 family glycosyltransferase|uniref:Glycosyl transferase family 2 n=1 Tax=Methylorubrum populi (strain ATCC BAA-705 / NCIMB 13946 / BJ001) TaxID=441620 RepID=B1ZII3_METPB|nr:glycosyltransferase family 2 protein [Methylorubrum populi]ACB80003.1 glycosyl transferase family 2 [Methylorubrum populi BJ001]OAH39978.1 glycosyl transferase [Methylorubrum populi]PZP68365.1 MAG: glycosyltransferase family 2 protein [Methylorubrum populi]
MATLAGRKLPVTGTDGADLRIDLAGAGLGGAWVSVTWHDAGSGGLARLLLSAVSDDGVSAPLAEEPLGGDAFAWTGRLPPEVAALRLTALSRTDPFALRDLAIRRRGRLGIVARAGTRQPGLTAQAVTWRLLGLKVRARGMIARALAHRAETGYAAWIARFDRLTAAERARIRAEIAGWEAPPLISVLMPVHDPDPRVLEAAIRSVRGQLYPAWELCIADDASTDPRIPRLIARHAAEEPRIRTVRRPENGHIARATNEALGLAGGAYAAFLDHDDLLSENALFEVARAVRADPELALIYSDEDKVDRRGRRFEPHFKSGYDRELLWAQNYVNHLCVVRTDALRRLGGLRPGFEGSQDHDLLLRLTEGLDASRVRHIPKVLYHWRAAAGSGTFSDRALARAEEARLRALTEIAARKGARAERGPEGFNRLVRPLPAPPPLVSVVIPTRDRAELLGVVLDGLFARTDYPALEVIVVDNGSTEPATRDLFARYAGDPRLRVLPAPGPFNFSELSNRGAAAARGTILLFLNNDIEVLEPGWLTELVAIASDREIGAVGAKLLYPDGTIQHGGIVLGIGGIAGHSHLGLPGSAPGYFARMVLSQEVSAVTGACLAMRAAVFSEVGGFDAAHLAVAFNDVDLCLKIRAAGYRIVWTPHARLVHHESKSRGAEDTPEKRARFEAESRVMRERWEPVLRADPYYNPNLSRAAAHYRL